ncbi:hypothetical protein F0562_004251 [Nyssa sinensis]|uniref:Uncharacterized protein n=1 Tax=Nyssa sinensis TaxID=561372 RepID=A0A5J5C1M0_9ASTE|nr:hypothetical protein F0562_004251 [Nyssa sinensis]
MKSWELFRRCFQRTGYDISIYMEKLLDDTIQSAVNDLFQADCSLNLTMYESGCVEMMWITISLEASSWRYIDVLIKFEGRMAEAAGMFMVDKSFVWYPSDTKGCQYVGKLVKLF